jgi:hypothetical protein
MIDFRRVRKKMHTLSEQGAKLFNVNLGKHLYATGNVTDILIHSKILAKLLDIREASVNLSIYTFAAVSFKIFKHCSSKLSRQFVITWFLSPEKGISQSHRPEKLEFLIFVRLSSNSKFCPQSTNYSFSFSLYIPSTLYVISATLVHPDS